MPKLSAENHQSLIEKYSEISDQKISSGMEKLVSIYLRLGISGVQKIFSTAKSLEHQAIIHGFARLNGFWKELKTRK
ncbi:MAG: hypothetical protein ACTSXL_00105 [Alphaproteobacteria bacterium]